MSANWTTERNMVELFVCGLENGVRGFDTAREYRVEKTVGKAIKEALRITGIDRKDVFIQSRISNEEIIEGNIKKEVQKSLKNMGLDYFDCFMFHWPTPDYYINAWKQLEKVYIEGNILQNIGICNTRMRHLIKMKEEVGILPQVIQVEVTPFWQINDIYAFCNENHIKIEAFSPLCKMIEPIRNNEVLNTLANKHGVTLPQVILRWNYQRGIAPISWTSHKDRVRSNFDIYNFELTDEDMNLMASLDCGYKFHLESSTCIGF